MDNRLITEEMRAAIGIESEPSVFEIEKEAIRRWAEAIGDNNPLYHDEEYAIHLGYRSIIAPPTFLPSYYYPLIRGNSKVTVKSPLSRGLNGGLEIERFKPLQAGDTAYVTRKLSDIYEKEGKLGRMLFLISEIFIRDKEGNLYSKARQIGITY